jgi:ABC-type Fe3+-siderophore transport system permease subunit
MPVTAKLSRRFYQQFGDEVTNELVEWFNAVDATYQSSWKELNELNFARFDAKQEQRFAQLELRLVRWMFGFWTGTMLALAGFLYVMLRAR